MINLHTWCSVGGGGGEGQGKCMEGGGGGPSETVSLGLVLVASPKAYSKILSLLRVWICNPFLFVMPILPSLLISGNTSTFWEGCTSFLQSQLNIISFINLKKQPFILWSETWQHSHIWIQACWPNNLLTFL